MAIGIRIEGRLSRLEAKLVARTAAGSALALDLRNVPYDELQAMWMRTIGDRLPPIVVENEGDNDPAVLHDLVNRYMAALKRSETRSHNGRG